MLSTKHFVNFLTKRNARLQLYLVIGIGLLATWALYRHDFIWINLLVELFHKLEELHANVGI